MMEILSSKARTAVSFGNLTETFLITFEANEEELIREVLKLFELEDDNWNDYQLMLSHTNSRIRHSGQLFQDDTLLLQRKEPLSLLEDKYSSNKTEYFELSEEFQRLSLSPCIQKSKLLEEGYEEEDEEEKVEDEEAEEEDEEEEEEVKIKVDVESLMQRKYKDRDDLKEKIDEWCAEKKMGVVFKTQERENLNGTKISTLYCNKRQKFSCSFYLEFRMNKDMENKSFYKLKSYHEFHNHSLNVYDENAAMTEEVLNIIRTLRPHSKSYKALCQSVNKQCHKNFHWRLIYYHAKKFEQEEIGHPTQDALNLIKMLEYDSQNRRGFYKAEFTENNQLEKCCYMSNRMKMLVNTFSDVLIIDGSYKVNRFNLPLIDVTVIDNHGKTLTCFFALLSNNKFESYVWVLKQLKSQVSKIPNIIFSDEEESLTKGISIFSSLFLSI